MGSIVQPL